LFRELRTRWYFDIRFLGEDLHDRTNAPALVRTCGVCFGIVYEY
jgi:hypothetical protein